MDGIDTEVKPKWVIAFSILAIAWNLMGMAMFAVQWMMTRAVAPAEAEANYYRPFTGQALSA